MWFIQRDLAVTFFLSPFCLSLYYSSRVVTVRMANFSIYFLLLFQCLIQLCVNLILHRGIFTQSCLAQMIDAEVSALKTVAVCVSLFHLIIPKGTVSACASHSPA